MKNLQQRIKKFLDNPDVQAVFVAVGNLTLYGFIVYLIYCFGYNMGEDACEHAHRMEQLERMKRELDELIANQELFFK